MRKIVILLLISLTTYSISAQVTWNVKGGVGFASIKSFNDEEVHSKIVGKIGLGLEIPIETDWSLILSLEMAGKGVKYDNCVLDNIEELFLHYTQIPIVIAYRLNLSNYWNILFKAGIYFAYAFSGKDKYEMNDEIYEEDMFGKEYKEFYGSRHFDFGLNLGLDFEYHRFVFGLEYEPGFIPIMKDKYEKSPVSNNNSASYITIGYKF